MDDVWGNAWSQPEEDVAHSVPAKPRLEDVPAWTFPSTAVGKDEEADVGIPSWSTGELNWMEPTGQASLWSSAPTADNLALDRDGWGTSSDLRLSSAGVNEQAESNSLHTRLPTNEGGPDDVSIFEEERSRSSTPDSVGTVTSPTVNVELSSPIAETISTLSAAVPSTFEVPESPDPFGSFEDGLASIQTTLDETGTTWTSPVAAFDDADAEDVAWGSAWETPDLKNTSDEAPKDEWAIAREDKARRDRSVPPELLAAIIDKLNDLSVDLWPEKDKPKFEQELGNWRDGMRNVDGFDEFVRRTLPEAPVQPPIQFSKSHTAKAMAKSLKLSKNLPIVRNSPMSHLFTAKSLAAWELSVKNKVKMPRDDIPAGWKTVEPEEKHDAKPTLLEKRSGGILSFFSKRTSVSPSPAPAPSVIDSKRSSHSREASSDTASGSTAARNSSDSNSISSRIRQSSSVSSLSSVLPATLPSPSAASFSTMPPPPSSSPTTASPNQAQEVSTEPATSPSSAPSAVSRFLNRFSRTRSNIRSSSSSPTSSIALSTDDLEFLSDIVPSHADDADEDVQLSSLTALVSSPALPAKLPPPLAPPPLAPPPRPSSLSRSRTPQPQPHPQPLLPSVLLPTTPKLSNSLGDLESLTPSGRRSVDVTMNNVVVASALPPPLPPPLSPTSAASLSKPSTPSPLSGGGVRAATSRASNSSTPPRTWSPAASISPPPKASSPHPAGHELGSVSPLSTGLVSAGSSSVETPVSTSYAQSNLLSGFSPGSSIPPPPIEKSPNRVFARATAGFFDDDDFSDFQSHPTPPPSMPMMQTSQIQASLSFDASFDTPSDQSMLPRHDTSQDDSFGDFGDFMSTTTSMTPALPMREPPSPLSPPIGPIGVPPPLPKKQTPANIKTQHVRKPSAADHDAAARLVERAAARPGCWPAPPSPIPEPLSPPPSGGVNSRTSRLSQSLLEFDNDPGIPQRSVAPVHSIALKPIAQITSPASSRVRVSSPPLLPPPSSNSSSISVPQASLLDFGDSALPAQTHATPPQILSPPLPLNHTPPASSAGSAKGGLSAQDLSFFEGL